MKTAIQKQLQINKSIITELHESIEFARYHKRRADENELIELEYHYHESLRMLRKTLKSYVQIQKTLKQIMKA